MIKKDVIIIGAGAAGLMCAIEAGKRGRKVLVIDHATKLGGKILISGGGRCNFTNTGAGYANYVSENPHFAKSALSRYRPEQFIQLVREHGIAFHEKKLGQLFCDGSAQAIVDLLKSECEKAKVEISLGVRVDRVEKNEGDLAGGFFLKTNRGELASESLGIATGGLSIPKLGATGFGYEVATQFGLGLTERAPALDGFVFSSELTKDFSSLSGVSLDCIMTCRGVSFRENILFTHSGLSGPAALQASLHWIPGESVWVNLMPGRGPSEWLLQKKREGQRSFLKNILSEVWPSRFAEYFCQKNAIPERPLVQMADKEIEAVSKWIGCWELKPVRTVGYGKAEVTRGGVSTDELSSKTMESKKVPGLFFIGEVVDVTGWLGGYNFQWAWASGWAAGQVV